jgi:hypothetical protein
VDHALDTRIRSDLAFLEDRVLGILRLRSTLDPEATPRDVDLCIVAPGQRPAELLLETFGRVDVRGRRYDLWVFEELPIWMRHEVLERHVVVWTGDLPALTEYLYHQRKLCEDMVQRRRKAV